HNCPFSIWLGNLNILASQSRTSTAECRMIVIEKGIGVSVHRAATQSVRPLDLSIFWPLNLPIRLLALWSIHAHMAHLNLFLFVSIYGGLCFHYFYSALCT